MPWLYDPQESNCLLYAEKFFIYCRYLLVQSFFILTLCKTFFFLDEPNLYALMGAELAIADGCYAFEAGNQLSEFTVTHSFESCLSYCAVRHKRYVLFSNN